MERNFSHARIERYRSARNGDKVQAAEDYAHNLRLAESMMPMLNVLEIGLRNALHARLSTLYGKENWWVEWAGQAEFVNGLRSIDEAKNKLKVRRERVTFDKILAELTFGFWCALFNARHQDTLWKDLRLAFPSCPRDLRRRKTISRALNEVRALRNRVFHHEPLLWLTPNLADQHIRGVTVVGWLDPALRTWLDQHDRFPQTWSCSPQSSCVGESKRSELAANEV